MVLAFSIPALAQRQAAVGPGVIPLDAFGILNGVDMSVSGVTGTLSVGTLGGPRTDIFSQNNPVVAGLLAVSTASSSQGNITFNSSSNVFGDIGATQPGGPFFLNLSAGAAGTTVNFQGSVFATSLNLIGTGIVNFNSGATNVSASNFAADGTIALSPNTTLIGALTTTAGASTGTLALGGGSVLNGAVGGAVGLRAINVTGGNNVAGVSATITGAANAFNLNLGTNTLNVGGALTIANGTPSGVIATTLASPTVFGNVRVTGATNLGTSLLVQATVPSTAFIPVGTTFNIVQTQAGTLQSGTDGSVVTVSVQSPTNPLYSFSAVPVAGTAAGLVTIRTDSIPLLVPLQPVPGVPLPPTLPIAAVIVPVLLTAPPSADLTVVLAAINNFSDPASVVDAVARLAPGTSGLQAPLLTFQGTRQFQTVMSSRFDDVQNDLAGPTSSTTTSCRLDDLNNGWWAKGFGYIGDQRFQSGFSGYDSRIFGTMIGHDTRLDRNTRAGLGAGISRSKVDSDGFDNSTEFETYQGMAYAAHDRGSWFVRGNLGAGSNDYSSRRRVTFTGVDRTAIGRYDGLQLTGFAEAGLRLFAGKFAISPLASLQYTHVKTDRFTEAFAGDLNLDFASARYDYVESGLGFRVTRPTWSRSGHYIPSFHARWLHELKNPDVSSIARFSIPGSPAFSTPGLKPADDLYNVGAGLTLISCETGKRNCAVDVVYDHDWRTDGYTADTGTVRGTHRF